jgi:hypothetical protein
LASNLIAGLRDYLVAGEWRPGHDEFASEDNRAGRGGGGVFGVHPRRFRGSAAATCKTANGGLVCVGSVSAAEDDECKSDRDGVRNNCRIISAANDGAFSVATQSDGLMVKIVRWLELVSAPYDGGPFLYLSPGNAENHAFALKPAPDQACK